MTDAPIALTVHHGHSNLPPEQQQLIAEWLRANRINPGQVCADQPITVLTVPYRPVADDGTPWLIQIVAFHQFYVGPDGAREENFLTMEPVSFQRTVPLIAPFPATPTTAEEGPRDGEADSQAAQEAPQEQVRPAREEGVPDRHEGQGTQRPGQGLPARDEGAAEEGPRRGDEAVPQLEEDRQPQEEGVGAR